MSRPPRKYVGAFLELDLATMLTEIAQEHETSVSKVVSAILRGYQQKKDEERAAEIQQHLDVELILR
jgi:hypothetical protein